MAAFDIFLIIILGLVSCLHATAEEDTAYPPCETLSTFSIQKWQVDTNLDVDFAFRLSTGFDDYTSLCAGQWRGIETEWQECDENSEDSSALFRGTSSGYLDVTHRYLCKRPGEAKKRNAIALTVANGTVILDFSQSSALTFNAYIKTMHRRPKTECVDASYHPEWIADGFEYEVGYLNTPGGPGPGGIAGVVASVSFDLLNKANDLSIHCSASYLSGSLSLENDTIIDPNKDWPCPSPYRSDLIPPGEYPTTSFRFDKAKRQFSLQQKWKCVDHDKR
ncbi:hypothetical protein F4774DRAFT_400386 [Daldinia eschscholtzii]|nr:hypothetical protein F4774DRAFT_400386 [Daldinia eschscholtzii]